MLLGMTVRLSGFPQTGGVELIDTFGDLESSSDHNSIPILGFSHNLHGGNDGLSWSDVHSASTVWCLVDAVGQVISEGSVRTRSGAHYLRKLMTLIEPNGVDASVLTMLQRCHRQQKQPSEEISSVESRLAQQTHSVDAIQRLMTIPGVGLLVASSIYAWVGEVDRFPNARLLASYAGLVPSVRQSGEKNLHGSLTKSGSGALRAMLVQSAHVVIHRCKSEEARPIQCIYERVRGGRGRKKIALCAVARHILRIAFYILRDETTYQPERMRGALKAA